LEAADSEQATVSSPTRYIITGMALTSEVVAHSTLHLGSHSAMSVQAFSAQAPVLAAFSPDAWATVCTAAPPIIGQAASHEPAGPAATVVTFAAPSQALAAWQSLAWPATVETFASPSHTFWQAGSVGLATSCTEA